MVGMVRLRSPTIRLGITYIDTAREKTKAVPAITPGRVSGRVTRKKRKNGPAPSVAAASPSAPSIWRTTA